MQTIEINIRVNEGWNNYPAKVTVTVDDKLHKVLSIVNGGRDCFHQGNDKPEDAIIYKKMGVMSKDSGYNWVSLSQRKYGQGIGMFYGGVASGTEYLDLDMVRTEGEYRYADLVKIRA
jgi:hypothetical protein